MMMRTSAKSAARLAAAGRQHRGLASSAAAAAAAAAEGVFSVEKIGDIAVITMDDPAGKVNTISTKMQTEFSEMLDSVDKDSAIKAAVIISGKKDNFIAGADIKELQAMKSASEGTKASSDAQKLLGRIAASKKPFIAAINGSCLGGGLEVALHCHYRIATSNKKTKLGLPEVKIGVLPGAGGTQRLPMAVGLTGSLDMILTGKELNGDRAKKMGLVHEVVDPFALRTVALQAAREIIDGDLKPKPKKKSFVNKLLEDNPLGRAIVFQQATKKAMEASGGNYPAIPKILKVLEVGSGQGLEAGLKAEAEAFGELTQTPECAALQSIFFGMTELKRNRYGAPTKKAETVGVLGAGLMGAGVAEVCAGRGFNVLLKDVNAQGLGRGIDQIHGNLDKKVKRRRMLPYDRDATMSKIIGLTNDDENWKKHFESTDLVVEAVLEDLGLKHKVFQEMETMVSKDCVLATNTSAIPIRDIAAGVSRPENVVGMHFFSPVDKMMLLEVIPHEKTSDEALKTVVDAGLRMGKIVIKCKDVPGFYVNRSLGPLMSSTMAVAQSGVPLEAIDKAMLKYGMPVGPISLCDEVGLDVAMHVQETLTGDLGVRMEGADSAMLEDFVAGGTLGRKSGKGFYMYPKKKTKGPKQVNPEAAAALKKYSAQDPKISEEEIQERIAFSFVNEAIHCLQDEIIESPVDGDIAAVFGIGFSPFRGGPFREVDRIGASYFCDQMNRYADKYGEQFRPAPLVVDMAKNGTKFHK